MRTRLMMSAVFAFVLSACHGGGGSGTPPISPQSTTLAQPQGIGETLTPAERGLWPREGPSQHVCNEAPARFASCHAIIRTDIGGITPNVIAGYHPKDLQTAYSLTTISATNGGGTVVAIVDAFDDTHAEADLAHYRSAMGLPPCTTSNGCFAKARLGTVTNTSWGEEESLDVDMVSAICPKCHILLVEAKSNSLTDLTAAEDYATLRARYVSNSWGTNESVASSTDAHYQKAGKVVTASTGDGGFNSTADWPAILPGVVGVGGTSLTSVSPRAEKAWAGAGSGCSRIYAKPAFQHTTGCTKRAEADLSADADPNTGVAVYDTFGTSGWLVFGGTSASAPIIASVYALAGNANTLAYLYAHPLGLNDAKTGSNGSCGVPLCTAATGWDGPTGMGTPHGVSAF